MLLAVQAEGRRALRGLTRARGPLDPAVARQCRDYAGDVLGSPRHAVWLKVYAAVQGRFREGWIPDNYFAEFVRPRINGTYHHMTRYRGANGLFFPDDTLPDVARLANGLILTARGKPTTAAEIRARARSKAYGLVFKSDASAYGHGLQFVELDDLTDDLLIRMGNGVLQRQLVPHPVFAPFGTRALATLRILTVVDDQAQPSARAGYLKLGRARDSHVKAFDNLRIPVDPQTGIVAELGYDSAWQPMSAHPDTGTRFDATALPRATDFAAHAVELHRLLPLARCICWDFAINQREEIYLLEWEGGVVNFGEATQGPCFLGLGWDRFHLA